MIIIVTVMSTVTFVKAEDKGKFVSCSVVSYDENGEEVLYEEPFYFDGKYLYADTKFFESCTLYYYDNENSAFVREGQKFNFSLSNLKIDFANKKATAKMMKSSKTYDLHNVIQYNEYYYLPVDQVCSFLKARIEVRDNKLYIKNSGISIADAAYMFNNYKYIFGYTHIVEDVFANCEKAYYAYAISMRFGSTVFGHKLQNLDFFHSNGNVEVYKKILEESVSDMSEYIETQKDDNTFEKRLSAASDLVNITDSFISKANKAVSMINNICKLFKDNIQVPDTDDLGIDFKQWGELLSGLSIVNNYTKYMLKMINMTEDHQKMLEEYNDSLDTKVLDIYNPLFQAFKTTYSKFGKSFGEGVATKIGEELYNSIPKKIANKIPGVAPYLKVIKIVNVTFKAMGIELDDDTSYNVLLEGDVERVLNERYESLYDNSGVSVQQSESFRRSAIFMLLSEKHGFETGNKLSQKINKADIFNDQLNNICARLNLFYRAAESKNFDSFAAMEDNCIENGDEIKKINGILKDYQKDNLDRREKINSIGNGNWQEAAIEVIYNLPKYAEINKMVNDFLAFELIDMNEDRIPEIIFYSISAGGGGEICNSYAYFDGKQYVVNYIDIDGKNSDIPTNTIIPYNDNNTNRIVYISGMFDEDYFDESLNSGSYASGYFWRNKWSQDIWEFKNNKLTLSKSFKVNEVKDFDKLYNPSTYTVEEQQEALDNVREYNQKLHETYSESDALYCECSINTNGIICDKYSMSSYHKVMNKEKATGFVNAYLNGKHIYSD